MKLWVNDIEPGTEVWIANSFGVKHGKIGGKDNSPIFRMSRRFFIADDGSKTSLFVNQYVYTEKNEAIEEELEILRSLRQKTSAKLAIVQSELKNWDEAIERLEKELKNKTQD